MKEQGLFHDSAAPEPAFSDTLALDLGDVEACIAGPGRPQDRVPLRRAKAAFESALPSLLPLEPRRSQKGADARISTDERLAVWGESTAGEVRHPSIQPHVAGAEALEHGSIVIAAITSCTNTSNPSVMLAAGLLAKRAVERGLSRKPWVKTSLAPGSRVVMAYYERAGLTRYLDQLGFNLVGYGCTTCIGNSGPLPAEISEEIRRRNLVVAAALSGNRNFEGRIHSEVRANYLMSPPLVVAFALAGRIDIDLETEPLGRDQEGRPVFLRDLWPSQEEIQRTLQQTIASELYRENYREIFAGDEKWRTLAAPSGDIYQWNESSTYVRSPPFFTEMPKTAPDQVAEIRGARALAIFGDSITTDHISPAGTIQQHSPAGQHLVTRGVAPKEFNSYGARRGNHDVMVRGTFANVRIRNRLAPDTEGGRTLHLPSGEQMSIYEASRRYFADGVPLIVLAGRDYGSGSSRDWAAKGPYLQGVRAVIAESFERIHRSNLVGMGILPLQFIMGASAASLGLTGRETFDIEGITTGVASGFATSRRLTVRACSEDDGVITFEVSARIETPQEVLYLRHGGILQCVLRQLLGEQSELSAAPTRKPHPLPPHGNQDATVDEGSIQSFPASDPASYAGSTRI